MYPALAAAEAMVRLYPDVSLSFVGNVGGFERPLIARAGIEFDSHDEVQAGPLHGVNPIRAITSVVRLGVGFLQAFRILSKRKPQVILSTGGWASLPVALAAQLRRTPMMIYLPDIEPGLTIKVLRRFAQKVAVTVADSSTYFKPGQTVVTGYPLRSEVTAATRSDGLNEFGLNPEKQTLLVFGGSRGARAINLALEAILGDLLETGQIQIVHVTGTLDWERSQEAIGNLRDHGDYHAFAYLHNTMGQAFAAADLAVCRAGASVLGEFPYFELPSILIPLAYSWHYQQVNADYLALRGAAIHLPEEQMSSQLFETICDLLLHQDDQLQSMRERLSDLAVRDGADNLAGALAQLAKGAA